MWLYYIAHLVVFAESIGQAIANLLLLWPLSPQNVAMLDCIESMCNGCDIELNVLTIPNNFEKTYESGLDTQERNQLLVT